MCNIAVCVCVLRKIIVSLHKVVKTSYLYNMLEGNV